jgi:uncharacterized Zn finger protein
MTLTISPNQPTLNRGIDLARNHRVRRRFRRGLFKVLGSRTYQVDVRAVLEGRDGATCSCPAYHFNPDAPCKHIVAALYFSTMKGWV